MVTASVVSHGLVRGMKSHVSGRKTMLARYPVSATSATDPGSLGGSITRYNKQLTEITEDQSELAERQEALRVQLISRFATTESRITSSQSTLTFLQNQIKAWNSSDD